MRSWSLLLIVLARLEWPVSAIQALAGRKVTAQLFDHRDRGRTARCASLSATAFNTACAIFFGRSPSPRTDASEPCGSTSMIFGLISTLSLHALQSLLVVLAWLSISPGIDSIEGRRVRSISVMRAKNEPICACQLR